MEKEVMKLGFQKGETNKGRPRRTDAEKIDKEYFMDELKKHSVVALETLIDLMKNSYNATIRFKACQYILDRTLGTTFAVFDSDLTEQARQLIIKIQTVETNEEHNNEWIEQQIADVEQVQEDLEDENWGTDVYCP